MEWWHAVVLGIVEGVTEFLPISSTAHLAFFAQLLGYSSADAGVIAFSAIIQVGAIFAAVIYFWQDIFAIVRGFLEGLMDASKRKTFEYAFGWAVLAGSLPIIVVGLFFQDFVETGLRNLWWMVIGLLGFTLVLWWADKNATQHRKESSVTMKDSLLIGLVQAVSLIPGVSRSGASTAAGLLSGFDRVTTTRLAFFLGIPALVGAAVLQAATHYDEIGTGVGWGATAVGVTISFIVGYGVIDWLLKFVARHSFSIFIWYRLGLGGILTLLLVTGVLAA